MRRVWPLLAGLVLLVVAVPLLAPYAPDAIDLANRRQGPSLAHWFGTDDLGRDVFSRVLFGGRVSIAIGLLSALVAAVVGVGVGALAGYAGGWTDAVLMRVTDAVLSIPRLLLLMVAAATLQPGVPALVLLVGAVGWMETARVTRTAVKAQAAREFVIASLAAGAGHLRIVWRHLLANAAGAIRTAAVIAVGRAILVESALSFFGVGVQPPDATWGSMLYQAQATMSTEPWLALFPGACIVLTVGTLNALSDRTGV
ncbi:MAG: ABC transporter permease [Vicinamibacterales bacterium]